jgi:tetratricopeptide (TPR) repeat protein
VSFFGLRFLFRMFLCGVAGFQLIWLLPMLAAAHGGGSVWRQFHDVAGRQLLGFKAVPPWLAAVAAMPWVLPLALAAVKWPSFEGELSPIGFKLTRFMFALLHIACLALALAMFFDFKYSPSVRMREVPVSFLTFYYMGALCVGYFSGYVLLVFNPFGGRSWERRGPVGNIANFCLFELIWVLAIGAPCVLAWQNYPRIRADSSGLVGQLAGQTLDSLPSQKAIILSDDVARLYLVQGACAQRGIANKHMLIGTAWFQHRDYIQHLVSEYPELKGLVTTNLAGLPPVLPSESLVNFLYVANRKYPIYYLHPSFGYYFETFYLKPHGLVYELKPYSTNLTRPPLATEAEITANQAYWAKLENGVFKGLPRLARMDSEAEAVSMDYSVALDYWGTELQKANRLKEAQVKFAEAVHLNTNNDIADINRRYNLQLQKGDARPIATLEDIERSIYKFRGLVPLLRYNGPGDEPELDLEFGRVMAEGHNLLQASLLFQRRLDLLPGDPEAELAMAKTLVDMRQPAKALELVHKLRTSGKLNDWELTRCEALAHMVSGDYATSEQMLRNAIQAEPNDPARVGLMTEYYRARGLEMLRERKQGVAAQCFSNALAYANQELRLLNIPSRSLDMPEALLQKAELEMLLRSYTPAIATLSQVLQYQPRNATALLNRAECELQLKKYEDAQDDLKQMGKLDSRREYVVEFSLAKVAEAQTNKAGEIAHLERCVSKAPKESREYSQATNRLARLQRH